MQEKEKTMTFPCFMYHKEHGARIFHSADEFRDAGLGWVDNPAKLDNAPIPEPESISVDDVSSLGDDELKERGKNLGIKGWAIMKRETLIKKIREAK